MDKAAELAVLKSEMAALRRELGEEDTAPTTMSTLERAADDVNMEPEPEPTEEATEEGTPPVEPDDHSALTLEQLAERVLRLEADNKMLLERVATLESEVRAAWPQPKPRSRTLRGHRGRHAILTCPGFHGGLKHLTARDDWRCGLCNTEGSAGAELHGCLRCHPTYAICRRCKRGGGESFALVEGVPPRGGPVSRAALTTLTPRQLRERAAREGCMAHEIEIARNTDDPKLALTELILECSKWRGTTLSQELMANDIGRLVQIAEESGIGHDAIEDARDDEVPHQALVQLLLGALDCIQDYRNNELLRRLVATQKCKYCNMPMPANYVGHGESGRACKVCTRNNLRHNDQSQTHRTQLCGHCMCMGTVPADTNLSMEQSVRPLVSISCRCASRAGIREALLCSPCYMPCLGMLASALALCLSQCAGGRWADTLYGFGALDAYRWMPLTSGDAGTT